MNLLNKPASWSLSVGIIVLVLIEVSRLPESGPVREFWRYYNGTFIEPLEIVALTLCVVGAWAFFFGVSVQRRWWNIARWFAVFIALVLGISLLIPYQGGGFVNFPGVRELAMSMLWALIFVLFTIVFTLAKR